jgi:hypothetical protein
VHRATETEPETIRRTIRKHRKLLSVPLVLGAVVAGVLAAGHASSFTSAATLWVDSAPPAQSSVGAGAPQSQPAMAEQTLLTELLATPSFAGAVVRNSLLSKDAGSNMASETAAAAALPTQITSTVPGPQVLQISLNGSNGEVVTSTLTALVNELEKDGAGLTTSYDESAISYYRSQVAADSKAAVAARSQVASYEAAHPRASNGSDPNLAALTSVATAANSQLTAANSSLNGAEGALKSGGDGWLVRVVDPPNAATSIAQGKKKLVEDVLGGLVGGALISFLVAVALTPTRKRDPWEDELSEAALLSGPRDRLGDGTMSPTPSGPNQAPAFAAQRQFIFQRPADDRDEQ